MRLKIFFFFLLNLSIGSLDLFAQGKYAGSLKKIIGKSFSVQKHFPFLNASYKFNEGTVISDPNDPNALILNVYQNATGAVVVFSGLADSVKSVYQIVDVIEIKNINTSLVVKTTGCQYGDTEGEIIVALVNPGKKAYVTHIIKAWICERDRLRFDAIGTNKIKCLNEGMDNE